MKGGLLIISSICLVALTACENRTTRTEKEANKAERNVIESEKYDADNTGRNLRDRNSTITADDQSETEADREITRRIRQALMEDDSLSTNAKNIKVITIREIVTLRGPVNTARERNVIAQKAKNISGVRNVDNQIEIIELERIPTDTSRRENGMR